VDEQATDIDFAERDIFAGFTGPFEVEQTSSALLLHGLLLRFRHGGAAVFLKHIVDSLRSNARPLRRDRSGGDSAAVIGLAIHCR
jgi:hypothetical protein